MVQLSPRKKGVFLDWTSVVRGTKTGTRVRSDIRGQVRRVLLTPHKVTFQWHHYVSLGCRRKKVRTKPSNDLVRILRTSGGNTHCNWGPSDDVFALLRMFSTERMSTPLGFHQES